MGVNNIGREDRHEVITCSDSVRESVVPIEIGIVLVSRREELLSNYVDTIAKSCSSYASSRVLEKCTAHRKIFFDWASVPIWGEALIFSRAIVLA